MNRRWQNPSPTLHPEIFHTKGLFEYARSVLLKEVFLFCDVHGHSRKKNAFLYGCSALQSWLPADLKRGAEEKDGGEKYLVRKRFKLDPTLTKNYLLFYVIKSILENNVLV